MRMSPPLFRKLPVFSLLLAVLLFQGAGFAQGIPWGGYEVRTDRVMAKFKEVKAGRAAAAALPDVAGVRRFQTIPSVVVIDLAASRTAAATRSGKPSPDAAAAELASRIKKLKASGLFDYVEPDYIVYANTLPADEAFTDGRLWGLRNTGQGGGLAGADIDAVTAWQSTTGSRSVVVAVIDTGIRHTHQDLVANMWRNPGETAGNGIDDDGNGYIDDVFGINALTGAPDPMDDNNHGTHCAGTIGAVANGGGPHVGVAWNVQLMGLKFLDAEGSGSLSDAITCIDYAIAKRADVMSNSWGGGGFSQSLADAIERANAAGILFIAAAGNEAADNDQVPSYPASYENANVVSVAALDRSDQLAGFSCYGATSVDIGAPGVAIFSSTADSDTAYDLYSGTSMATPHVSGVVALLKSRYPAALMPELRNRLLQSARRVSSLAGKCVTGGALDAAAALTVEADGILEVGVSSQPAVLASGGEATLRVAVADLFPLSGATVSGSFGDAASRGFFDNGAFPDAIANDGIYSARVTVPDTSASSIRLSLFISAPGKQTAFADFDLPIIQAPENDDFADRTEIGPGQTTSTGSNGNSSREPGEPANPVGAGGKSVWWSWTSGVAGNVTITTTGSNFDTTLAVYTGADLGALVLMGANDDSQSLQSAVTFPAAIGVSYAIQVDGYAGETGAVVLNHPLPGAGAEAPPVIAREPRDAAVAIGDPLVLQVEALGAGTLSYQWFFNGEPLAGADDAEFFVSQTTLANGGVYRVAVANSNGQTLSRNVSVAIELTRVRPPNDNFAEANSLAGTSGVTTGTNRAASAEAGEPNHAGASDPVLSVWWRWTAPADGLLELDTSGSNFNTTLAIYTGGAVNALLEVAADDDGSEDQTSVLSLQVRQGTVYHIAVAGHLGATGTVFLNHNLTASGDVPPNDDFSHRAVFPEAGAIGTNIAATGEPGERNHAAFAVPIESVWWEWTAETDGAATFDTFGSDYDTVLAVYTGDSVGNLTLVAENDDSEGLQSRVDFNAGAGETYMIAVDGYNSAEGSIALNRSFIARRMTVVGDRDPLLWRPDLNYLRMHWSSMNQRWEAMLQFRKAGTAQFKFAVGPTWAEPNYGLNPSDPGRVVRDGGNLSIAVAAGQYVFFAFDEVTLTYFVATVSEQDADGDGLPDAWQEFHEVDLAENDADGDGITNGEEFQRGTNPAVFDQGIHIAGAFNGWSLVANPMQHLGSGRWRAFLNGPLTGVFKFQNGSWERNWGEDSVPSDGVADSYGGDIAWPVLGEGWWQIDFNEITLDYRISLAPAGVSFSDWLAVFLLPSNADPLSDEDADGLSLIEEFALGADPHLSDGNWFAPTVLTTGSDLVLTWLQRTDRVGVVVVPKGAEAIEDREGRITLAAVAIQDQRGVPEGFVLMQATMAVTGSKGFMWLETSMP